MKPVVVSGADSQLEEAVIIAEYLSDLNKTWAEVVAVMENCPGELKLLSWELLDENQKERYINNSSTNSRSAIQRWRLTEKYQILP